MKQFIVLFALSVLSHTTYCQTITFTDLELKRYLVNAPCADTTSTSTWQAQFDVDTNNDNEIQISEALAVQYLILQDPTLSYSIQALDDLAQFKNLVTLSIHVPILEFDKIQLDSLKSLFIIDIEVIKKIDISNLPNLTDAIQIDGITTLDTLNIRNGSSASLFSLFYSQNIKYACVDSIASEYNAFATFGAMFFNTSPSINCLTVGIADEWDEKNWMDIYPNPTIGLVELRANDQIDELHVLNAIGETVFQAKNVSKSLDISSLNSGVYFFNIRVRDQYFWKKVILN